MSLWHQNILEGTCNYMIPDQTYSTAMWFTVHDTCLWDQKYIKIRRRQNLLQVYEFILFNFHWIINMLNEISECWKGWHGNVVHSMWHLPWNKKYMKIRKTLYCRFVNLSYFISIVSSAGSMSHMHVTRNHTTNTLILPKFNTNSGRQTFHARAGYLWNSVPTSRYFNFPILYCMRRCIFLCLGNEGLLGKQC